MEDKNKTDVLIDGKIYSLSGASAAYIQKVSGYINTKIAETKTSPGYKNLDAEYRSLLLNLSIAEDYFSAYEETEALKKRVDELEKELYEARHDVISAKVKLEKSMNGGKRY
ncbi:MAG: cell division protein ZapA [Eubacteriales bacterium]|nr:cell division protein ZapA [Eubacteriales bacterium]